MEDYGTTHTSRAAKRGGQNMRAKDNNTVSPGTSMDSMKKMPTDDGRTHEQSAKGGKSE